jgi:hypothetical protein
LIPAPPGARKDIPTMRKIVLTVTAALALAAGALPAAAGADPGPSVAPSPSDTALRPTAIEYGLIAALLDQQPPAAPRPDNGPG